MAAGVWVVSGTKKGALPVSVEKRPKGKATVVRNITSNPRALLSELRVPFPQHLIFIKWVSRGGVFQKLLSRWRGEGSGGEKMSARGRGGGGSSGKMG